MLSRVEDRQDGPRSYPVGPSDARWPDDDAVPEAQRRMWIEDGFVVLPNLFAPAQLQGYRAIVDQVRREVEDDKDEHGYGDRIGQLHQRYPELLELASAPEVLRLLKWAFNDDPVVFGSLNFERGTQQADHIDAIFFWPEPTYTMAGVWVALEDIHPDAGPLFYVPGSHAWPFARSEDVVATRPELAARRRVSEGLSDEEKSALSSEIGSAWHDDFQALKTKRGGVSKAMPIKAGDVVIWHSLLAHGGSPRNDPTLSRNSVVFHYVGKHTKLYTFEQFMLLDDQTLKQAPPQPMTLGDRGDGLEYMRYNYFVSYSGGKQLVHELT
jgi:ectoine hydroxylase-related dioxygenase (phytanoyl-CoA dioxygenase family)